MAILACAESACADRLPITAYSRSLAASVALCIGGCIECVATSAQCAAIRACLWGRFCRDIFSSQPFCRSRAACAGGFFGAVFSNLGKFVFLPHAIRPTIFQAFCLLLVF